MPAETWGNILYQDQVDRIYSDEWFRATALHQTPG